MKASEFAQNKWVFIVAMLIVMLWAVLFASAIKLPIPYLYTSFSIKLRAFVVFPLLSLFIFWFVFIHKWEETSKTGYQMVMASLKNRKERIKHALLTIVSFVFITSGISWMLIAFPIWAAYLTASNPFMQRYGIQQIESFGNHYDLKMIEIPSGKLVALVVTASQRSKHNLKIGDTVCLTGRSSVFGSIIEYESFNKNNCESENTRSKHTESGLTSNMNLW